MRDAALFVRLPSEVKKALQRAAEADRRTMSGMALKLLCDGLEAKGFLKPPKGARP